MRQLTALDQLFLNLEDEATYGHVGSVAVLDPSTAPGGELTLQSIQDELAAREHLLPLFSWKLAPVPFGLDRPYWVEDERFDLGYHVRELALPAPGSDEQLAEQVARIFSRRLDRKRPLWELYVIHGLPEGRVAVMTKIHHAMVDGMSGAEIMSVLYDLAPEGRELPDKPARHEVEARPGTITMAARAVAGMPLGPVRALRRLPQLLPHIDVAPSVLGIPGAEGVSRTLSRARNALGGNGDGAVVERPTMRAPRVSFSGSISPHRKFAFGSLSLADVKRVKDHFGVKVNDVVVAITAGAVRRWLIAHDELPDRPLLTQVPVSVRTDEERGTYGNQISVMIVPLPTDEADPEDRLRCANTSMLAAKERHKALPAKALRDVTTFIPPVIYSRATRVAMQLSVQRGMRPLYNLVISNVPGPPIPIYMAGARLEALYPVSVITKGAGLNVTVMSYLDRVDVGIVADREQMPDLQDLVGGMRAELDDLVALCG